MNINSQVWIDVIRKEYLQDFIKRGGAAVKFVISDKEVGNELFNMKLRKMAEEENYFYALVDAVSTKIHMIDKIFHEVACQVEWDTLSYHFIAQIFKENGYNLPERREDMNMHQIALLNNREEKRLRREFNTWLEQKIYRDFEMSQEFRLAMIRLCLDQLDTTGPSSFLVNAVKEWLRGELRLISTLKEALIFQKIARHNARHMLFSLAHWLKINGINGLILGLDISRYVVSKRSKDPDDGFFYSIPAVLDAYEVLRQFIDETDEIENCLIVVFSTRDFLGDDKRGLNRYEALRFRLGVDEVRDRHRQNPLASLIRLSNEMGTSA